MLKRLVAIALIGSSVTFAGKILPNDELQLGLLAQAAQKKLVTLANMHLKGEVKEKFGNLYDEYTQGLMKIRLKKLQLIKEYAKNFKNMTDDKANKLLDDWMKVQKEELGLKEKYIAKFKKIMPASMVMRFYQIDNRINLLQEARVSALIPLTIPDQARRMQLQEAAKTKAAEKPSKK
ncbi:hypothetical protein [Nitratifractor sp.]